MIMKVCIGNKELINIVLLAGVILKRCNITR
jgi:hypothetical protein